MISLSCPHIIGRILPLEVCARGGNEGVDVPTLPKIEGDAREALRVVSERGVVPGTELLCAARLETTERLTSAVKPLLDSGLIAASGNVTDPTQILSAYFNVKPSVLPLVRYVLGQAG